MDRRTYEGHMDWEYENARPLDPTSPFAQAARGASQTGMFATPSKHAPRPNLFGNIPSPTKSHASPPRSSTFHTPLRSQPSAPAFRNPAFTTPRKPFDEVVMSEASGAEDSPAPTETSDYPNETPDVDKFSDATINGNATITPLKVDKAMRYGRTGPFSRKHAPGKGEIRTHGRGMSTTDVTRKRRRHIYDRDVGSASTYQRNDWDSSDSDSQDSHSRSSKGRSRRNRGSEQDGWVRSVFTTMNDHPDAPENLLRWLQFGFNSLIILIGAYFCWGIVSSVRSDTYYAFEKARQERFSKMMECQTQYTKNACAENKAPALQVMCDEWYECMAQNPESIMRFKTTVKHVAEIINEFSDTMSIKGWVFVAMVILLFTWGNVKINNAFAKPSSGPNPQVRNGPQESMPTGGNPSYVYMVQTPMRHHRHAMLDEGTDTDASPPAMPKFLPQPMPSGRRSPSKEDRSLSPVKLRNPGKYY
ncbi:nucleus export protein Brr6 [Stachybotrys elegans]|uniref:Nucleus export protein Brr6 n=1 Tax=Stachybotrys elegans TaxID=80388 RepID=A0A8K0WLH3_9HYPO|nr:nucleus export protein Brr6 [Stachybotrys elegans]